MDSDNENGSEPLLLRRLDTGLQRLCLLQSVLNGAVPECRLSDVLEVSLKGYANQPPVLFHAAWAGF